MILFCTVLTGITCAEPAADQNGQSLPAGTAGSVIGNATGIAIPQDEIGNLTDFVKKGVDFARNNSKEDALARFNDVNGEFVQGDRYIFAYDMNCTTLALPFEQEWIGKDRTNITDPNGMAYLQAIRRIAEYGGGYIYYVKANPVQNNTEQVKFTYVEPVDTTWFIGSGFYIPQEDALIDKGAIAGLKARVEKAAAFGEKEGKERASLAFNDRNGSWEKEGSDIFAYDLNGTVLALPFLPEKTGTNRMDMTDRYGSPAFRLMIDNAIAGGGFNYIIYYNPDTGKDEMKFCYVLPVQDDWMVGSGIYLG